LAPPLFTVDVGLTETISHAGARLLGTARFIGGIDVLMMGRCTLKQCGNSAFRRLGASCCEAHDAQHHAKALHNTAFALHTPG
jgi:hypothetical protein